VKIEGMLKSKPASGGTFYKGQVRGRACHPGLRPCAQGLAARSTRARCGAAPATQGCARAPRIGLRVDLCSAARTRPPESMLGSVARPRSLSPSLLPVAMLLALLHMEQK